MDRRGKGDMVMSPTGGIKASTPPSTYKSFSFPTVTASLGALYNGMKQEAATTSKRCCFEANCDTIVATPFGLGHTFVIVTNNRFCDSSNDLLSISGSSTNLSPVFLSLLKDPFVDNFKISCMALAGSILQHAIKEPKDPDDVPPKLDKLFITPLSFIAVITPT